jgi:GNAT superfamily N-acetyltransferase
MTNVTYRPWREGDDLALLEIWGDAERSADDRALFREASDDPFVRTIVAEDSGIPVAAGVVSEASVHPERLWAYVEVAKDHRNFGIGSTLLTMLRHELDGVRESKPGLVTKLRSKVIPGSDGAHFAESVGLEPIQRSRIVRVEPGALQVSGLTEESEAQVEDLATGSVELTRALWDFYRAVHQWDPPAELGLGKVNQLFLGEAAGAHGAVVLRIGGSIQAFAISYERHSEEAPADVLFGYAPEAADVRSSIAKLLALLVHQYPVEIELDDSMTELVAVVEPLLEAGKASVIRESLVVSD